MSIPHNQPFGYPPNLLLQQRFSLLQCPQCSKQSFIACTAPCYNCTGISSVLEPHTNPNAVSRHISKGVVKPSTSEHNYLGSVLAIRHRANTLSPQYKKFPSTSPEKNPSYMAGCWEYMTLASGWIFWHLTTSATFICQSS